MIRFAVRQYLPFALFALLFSLSTSSGLQAQAPPKTPKSSGKKTKSGAKAANIKMGTLLSLDPDALKITLKTAAGETLTYNISDSPRFYHDKKEADASAFKPGASVTIKLRKTRNKATFFVFELADSAIYDWLTDLRKNTQSAVIKDISEDLLTVTISGADAAYTVSDKTRWSP